MEDTQLIEIMRDAVLQEYGGDSHANAFTTMDNVPEGLRPVVRAVSAACLVGQLSKHMDPRDPRVLHWKRSAIEEIDHQAGLLADPDYREATL